MKKPDSPENKKQASKRYAWAGAGVAAGAAGAFAASSLSNGSDDTTNLEVETANEDLGEEAIVEIEEEVAPDQPIAYAPQAHTVENIVDEVIEEDEDFDVEDIMIDDIALEDVDDSITISPEAIHADNMEIADIDDIVVEETFDDLAFEDSNDIYVIEGDMPDTFAIDPMDDFSEEPNDLLADNDFDSPIIDDLL